MQAEGLESSWAVLSAEDFHARLGLSPPGRDTFGELTAGCGLDYQLHPSPKDPDDRPSRSNLRFFLIQNFLAVSNWSLGYPIIGIFRALAQFPGRWMKLD
jgi:hypothetical protein